MSDTYDPTAYGAHMADEYDQLWEGMVDTEAAVACLGELAGAGPVLELGVGTGRLALPLAGRGVPVHGVDASEAMVAKLRAKPGGEALPVTIGDFADVQVGGSFSLVVLALNTIFALPTQDAQVACFQNAARHLGAGGRFVVEAWVPDPVRFSPTGSMVGVRRLTPTAVSLEVAELDPVDQRMRTTQVSLRDGHLRLHPANHRYAWPSELDLMARVAGMRREHRWSGWGRAPFTAESRAHVTVYRRPEA